MSDIPTINRDALILIPTESCLAWARALPDSDPLMTEGDAQHEPTIYLIPEDIEPEKYLRRRFNAVFEEELAAWCTNPDWWPEDLTFKLFTQFFTVHISTMVYDLGIEPIEKDDMDDDMD